MTSPADLERITHKLDQAYAIMAFPESAAQLAAVQVLLGKILRGAYLPQQPASLVEAFVVPGRN
jgi:hypothetical protein